MKFGNASSNQSYISESNIYESVKIYEIWKGNNYFLNKGKIYIGAKFYYGILTNIYIHILSWLFIKNVIMVINILFNIEIRKNSKNIFNNNRIYILYFSSNYTINLYIF